MFLPKRILNKLFYGSTHNFSSYYLNPSYGKTLFTYIPSPTNHNYNDKQMERATVMGDSRQFHLARFPEATILRKWIQNTSYKHDITIKPFPRVHHTENDVSKRSCLVITYLRFNLKFSLHSLPIGNTLQMHNPLSVTERFSFNTTMSILRGDKYSEGVFGTNRFNSTAPIVLHGF